MDSVSSVTGSLTVAGGVGIAKDLYVGGLLVITSGTSVQPPFDYWRYNCQNSLEYFLYGKTATFKLQRSRGAESAPTAVHSNDFLGDLNFQGFDGTTFQSGATVRGINENAGAPLSANQAGGKMMLQTSGNNGVSPERCCTNRYGRTSQSRNSN